MISDTLTKSLTSLTEEITNNDEIELIYYNTEIENNNVTNINLNVVLNIDSVIAKEELLKLIVANMELIRTLYSNTPIKFNYLLKSLNTLNSSKKELNKLKNANIIYDKIGLLDINGDSKTVRK